MRYDYTDYKDTWKAMEKLVEKGLVKAIGLSNFNSRQIDDVLSVATVKPAVLQVRWIEEMRTRCTFLVFHGSEENQCCLINTRSAASVLQGGVYPCVQESHRESFQTGELNGKKACIHDGGHYTYLVDNSSAEKFVSSSNDQFSLQERKRLRD